MSSTNVNQVKPRAPRGSPVKGFYPKPHRRTSSFVFSAMCAAPS